MPNTILIFIIVCLSIVCWFLWELWQHDKAYWKAQMEKDREFWSKEAREYDEYINQN